jgi:hypothetical protein
MYVCLNTHVCMLSSVPCLISVGQINHVGFEVNTVALGHGFCRVLRFPLPILIPPVLRFSRLSSMAGTIAHDDNNDSVKFFVYLRAEFNSQWPIIESARIRITTAVRQHRTKQKQKRQPKKQ